MLLENKYYRIVEQSRSSDGGETVFRLAILPDCEVYKGHFPGDPVCPGVCNIETIRECAMLLTDKTLHIQYIKQCRLTAIATPSVCPEVTLRLNATDNGSGKWLVVATIADERQAYMEFKGTLTESL